jgi:WD40 repeat protein
LGETILWDAATGNVAKRWSSDARVPGPGLFAPDGTPLSVSIDEGELTILDLNTGLVWLQVQSDAFFGRQTFHFALSPDGRWLLGSGDTDGSYSFVLDVEKGTLASAEIDGVADARGGRAFSPDGSMLVTAKDGRVTLTETASGTQHASAGWFTPFSHFSSTSFDPKGRLIATAGPDEAIWLRDGEDATLVQLIRAFGAVNSAYFNPAGDMLVVTPRDGPVRILANNPFDDGLWREIAAFDTSLLWLSRRAAFTPDGRHILVWSTGEAHLYPAPERGRILLDKAQEMAPRCLSVEERRRYFLDPAPPRWCITGPGLEGEANERNWKPVSPYRTLEWRRWLVSQSLPRKPTEY